jgi:tetratricopeptide (TPR) repeat protein
VILTYARSFWEITGMIITIGGLVLMIVWIVKQRIMTPGKEYNDRSGDRRHRFWKKVERLSSRSRQIVFIVIVIVAISLVISGAILRNRPVRTYIAGYQAYNQGNYQRNEGNEEQAERSFKKAIQTMKPLLNNRAGYDHRDVINSLLITAMCHENLNQYEKAEDWYRTLIKEYPYSRYITEGYVKLARIYKHRSLDYWGKGLNRLRDEFGIQGQQQRIQGLNYMKQSLEYYLKALQDDPYSVWAGYAKEDLESERDALLKAEAEILALPIDIEVRHQLHTILKKLTDMLRF